MVIESHGAGGVLRAEVMLLDQPAKESRAMV
jgi:hypothetical protein